MKYPKIYNSEGKEIILNAEENRRAKALEHAIQNALGYEIPITTLTTIMKRISDQKFFSAPPAEYLPVRVGEGAWSSNLTTYRSFAQGGAFSEGVLNTGANSARLASADAGVDSITVPVINWAKEITWTIMDLEQAAKSGNWDIVSSKERARKMNWDLGIQQVAFLGLSGSSNVKGLLTQSTSGEGAVTVNSTVITKAISSMTPSELKTFTKNVYEAYRANSNRTAVPTHFIIPESDYNGLASQSSPDFPVKSVLELLREAFAEITRKADFKILPLAYADATYSGASYQTYVLLNYDEESIRMDLPVDYTNTLANSLNNFSFQNVGYGQFTGVGLYRPAEFLYFRYNV